MKHPCRNIACFNTQDVPEMPCPECNDAFGKARAETGITFGAWLDSQAPQQPIVDWEAVAKEYRRLYECEVGADCAPYCASTEAGENAIKHTHKKLDAVVTKHTATVFCHWCKHPEIDHVMMPTETLIDGTFCLIHCHTCIAENS